MLELLQKGKGLDRDKSSLWGIIYSAGFISSDGNEVHCMKTDIPHVEVPE